QPYCRLAIITMQMMPKISCPQRVASDAVARAGTVVAVVVDICSRPHSWLWSLLRTSLLRTLLRTLGFYSLRSGTQSPDGMSVLNFVGPTSATAFDLPTSDTAVFQPLDVSPIDNPKPDAKRTRPKSPTGLKLHGQLNKTNRPQGTMPGIVICCTGLGAAPRLCDATFSCTTAHGVFRCPPCCFANELPAESYFGCSGNVMR